MPTLARSASGLVLLLASVSLLHLGRSHASADCRDPAVRAQVAQATDIFLGRFESTENAAPPLRGGSGAPDMQVTFVVSHVFAGALEVGDRVRVRWAGFVEPPPRMMHVRGEARRHPAGVEMLVLARREPDGLRANATLSTVSSPASTPPGRETLDCIARRHRRR